MIKSMEEEEEIVLEFDTKLGFSQNHKKSLNNLQKRVGGFWWGREFVTLWWCSHCKIC